MPFMKCPGCAGDIEYQKGEWRAKCPFCGEWRETGEPKPIIKPPQVKPAAPAVSGLTETVGHYLERLRKWRINCAKVIIFACAVFFGGAVLYLKGNPEIAMPILIFAVGLLFMEPQLFANSRPKPLGPPASEKYKAPPTAATDLCFILIDIAAGAATAFAAIQIFGPFEWK